MDISTLGFLLSHLMIHTLNSLQQADSRLPKLLMHGQLVGQNCRGRPRTVWNDVVLFDIHKLKLNRYTRDALNKPVWRELTCVART